MKSVLISVHPKWCELIANGKKTVEVRKTRPKIDVPFKCYIYCTQGKDVLAVSKYPDKSVFLWEKSDVDRYNADMVRNGKVIGEFVCDGIYTFRYENGGFLVNGDIATTQDVQAMSCLSDYEFRRYAKGKSVYGWHISDLVIYDKPKGLHHFFKPCGNCDKKGTRRCTEELTDCRAKVIERPPQSWCYVKELE